MATSDICVFPSRNDAFGAVIIEAWAAKKPNIACKSPGPQTIISNKHDGLLVGIDNVNELADAIKVVSSTHYFTLAESLGGVESLCGHPASMTHAAIPKEERKKTGVVDSLIRLSVGIEDIEDLVADLGQALAKL